MPLSQFPIPRSRMLLYSMLGQRFLIVILFPRGKFICSDVMSVIATDPVIPEGGWGWGGGGRTPTDLAAGVPHPILLILILFRTTAYRFLELFSDLDSSNPLYCLSILNYEQHSTRNIVTTDIYCVPNSEKGIWIFNSIIIVSCIRSF